MKSFRENPDGEENQKASRQADRELFALKMQSNFNSTEPCPECYGGHFRPCQVCGDTGRVSMEDMP